jgi:hypothetical protein
MCMLPEKVKTVVKGSARRGEEVFIIFRDYVKHEDMLINQRMTWMITIQSFLIATFGFSYQKKLEIISKIFTEPKSLEHRLSEFMLTIQMYNAFLVIICIVGIRMSRITFLITDAANHSIGGLEKKWEATSKLYETDHLPKLTGGDGDYVKAKESGKKLSRFLTRFFIGFWVVIIIFMLIEAYCNFQIKPLK